MGRVYHNFNTTPPNQVFLGQVVRSQRFTAAVGYRLGQLTKGKTYLHCLLKSEYKGKQTYKERKQVKEQSIFLKVI